MTQTVPDFCPSQKKTNNSSKPRHHGENSGMGKVSLKHMQHRGHCNRPRRKVGETAARESHRPSSRPGQHHLLSPWLLQQEKRIQHPPCPLHHGWSCGSPYPDLAPWGQQETFSRDRSSMGRNCNNQQVGLGRLSSYLQCPSSDPNCYQKASPRAHRTVRPNNTKMSEFGGEKGLGRALQGEAGLCLKKPKLPQSSQQSPFLAKVGEGRG